MALSKLNSFVPFVEWKGDWLGLHQCAEQIGRPFSNVTHSIVHQICTLVLPLSMSYLAATDTTPLWWGCQIVGVYLLVNIHLAPQILL